MSSRSPFQRPTTGSVVCPSCGRLVGVRDARCLGCGRANPGLWGFAPMLGKLGRDLGFSRIVVFGCVGLYALSLIMAPGQIDGRIGLGFLSPGGEPLYRLGMSGAVPIFNAGRWWTVLSAAWLHGSLLHIGLNLWWIGQLAPPVAERFGPARLVLIYTASSIGGFVLTSIVALMPMPGFLSGAFFTVGASAPISGLLGALVLYGKRCGDQLLSQRTMQILIFLIVIGFVAGLGGQNAIRIDNWAHLGGFGGGYLAARWLDPLENESPTHTIGALVCLLATAAAIAASLLAG